MGKKGRQWRMFRRSITRPIVNPNKKEQKGMRKIRRNKKVKGVLRNLLGAGARVVNSKLDSVK